MFNETKQQIILEDLLAERRSRREPEHLLVGASIAYAAAVVWGVASLATLDNRCTLIFAGVVTMVGSLLIMITSLMKVWRSHQSYANNQRRIARMSTLVKLKSFETNELSPLQDLYTDKLGDGVWYSIAIICVAYLVAATFSLVVVLSAQSPSRAAHTTQNSRSCR